SSRRRHTRFSRDWSSDVCSSDLELQDQELRQFQRVQARPRSGIADPVGVVERVLNGREAVGEVPDDVRRGGGGEANQKPQRLSQIGRAAGRESAGGARGGGAAER